MTSSDSVMIIPKETYKELIKNKIETKVENENLKLENSEIKKIAIDKYKLLNDDEKKNRINSDLLITKSNMIENEKDEDMTDIISSVFKKKKDCNSEKQNKKINHVGVEPVEPFIPFNVKSNSETSDTSLTSSYDSYDKINLYEATETEDGTNRAYKYISKKVSLTKNLLKGGKISKKQAIQKMKILMDYNEILDYGKYGKKEKNVITNIDERYNITGFINEQKSKRER